MVCLHQIFRENLKHARVYPHIERAYHEIHPYRLVETYNRKQLFKNSDEIYPFGKEEAICVPKAEVISDGSYPKEFNQVEGTHKIPQPYVAVINKGRILPKIGVATTEDCTLLLDSASSREEKIKWMSEFGTLRNTILKQQIPQLRDTPDRELNTAVSLIRTPYSRPAGRFNIGTKGYSHWVQSYLTLLQGVEVYKEKTGEKPMLILEPDPPSWLLDSIKHMGFISNDLFFWDPQEKVQIDRLVVPSVRRMERTLNYDSATKGVTYKLLSPTACKWLKNKATCLNVQLEGSHDFRDISTVSEDQDTTIEYSKNIFISRADANRRRIKNRSELFENLKRYGFRKYELSELSFSQQVRLFNNADIIVSPHGAGLSNIMFSNNAYIVELFGWEPKPTYYLQSVCLDLEYACFVGESSGKNEDFYTNPKRVCDKVSKICESH